MYKVEPLKEFKVMSADFEKLTKDTATNIFKGPPKEEAKVVAPVIPKVEDHLFTKDNVKAIFLAAFDRKPEELKEEEFKYFVDKIPPAEAGKDGYKLKEITERFKAYSDELHYVPSKKDLEKMANEGLDKAKVATMNDFRKQELGDGLLSFCYYYGDKTKDNLHDCELLQSGDKIR